MTRRAQTLNIMAGAALAVAGGGLLAWHRLASGLPDWLPVVGAFAIFGAAWLIFESTVSRLFSNGFLRLLVMAGIGLILTSLVLGEDVSWTLPQ